MAEGINQNWGCQVLKLNLHAHILCVFFFLSHTQIFKWICFRDHRDLARARRKKKSSFLAFFGGRQQIISRLDWQFLNSFDIRNYSWFEIKKPRDSLQNYVTLIDPHINLFKRSQIIRSLSDMIVMLIPLTNLFRLIYHRFMYANRSRRREGKLNHLSMTVQMMNIIKWTPSKWNNFFFHSFSLLPTFVFLFIHFFLFFLLYLFFFSGGKKSKFISFHQCSSSLAAKRKK